MDSKQLHIFGVILVFLGAMVMYSYEYLPSNSKDNHEHSHGEDPSYIYKSILIGFPIALLGIFCLKSSDKKLQQRK